MVSGKGENLGEESWRGIKERRDESSSNKIQDTLNQNIYEKFNNVLE